VRSDDRIVTYLADPKRSAKQENDGWWRMGDVGYKTRWGCLHLLDREVDVIPGTESTREVGDPVQRRIDDLPQTATTKVQRLGLARVIVESASARPTAGRGRSLSRPPAPAT
jgi:acyl-coenzyme A synthetase/AMP-(fatty) acid ligase